jgi:hypothetical protein
MMPIGTLGAGPPRRSLRPRIVLLTAVTAVTVGLLVWTSLRGDGASPDRRTERSATTARRTDATTAPTAATATTAHPFVLDPSWLPKGSSRYSESEESKRQADELQGATTTTTRPAEDRSSTTDGSTTDGSAATASATP